MNTKRDTSRCSCGRKKKLCTREHLPEQNEILLDPNSPTIRSRLTAIASENELTERNSFYVSSWKFEFEDDQEIFSRDNEPRENVRILLNRTEKVKNLLISTLGDLSGVYFGKTTEKRLRTRFNELNLKKFEGKCIVLVVLAEFVQADVPEDLLRYQYDPASLAFRYEIMLQRAAKEKDFHLYQKECEEWKGPIKSCEKSVIFCLFTPTR